ncbi:MAG: glycyl-radical enzyme activating protein [Deltaproteobacteria bacterium]|nr:glycyl-radical enzyme activating protein [Deltaproteobacteria bacterium]MBW1846323.1 glycyl-radical enzyme activating protein [Deltaproteobacteria bacterium]
MTRTTKQATILEIQRMSTEDGPGIRTTVFFKGCPLNCSWCHNPESISPRPQIQWVGSKCIGCKTCIETCPEKALTFTDNGVHIDRSLCKSCGTCADACPSTAMELIGQKWELDDLVNEVIKDKAYFDKSGGGITLSGGEPTMQSDFAAMFLQKLRGIGIHTALDTCGLCSKSSLEKLLPYSSMVLFDVKEINPDKHETFTGSKTGTIHENLIFTAEFIKSHIYPQTLWIRTPLIPGATASKENIKGIGHFIASHLGDIVDRWELCAFNNLCKDKYIRLGLEWPFKDKELLLESFISELTDVARHSGVNPDIVHWSGTTKLELHDTDTVSIEAGGERQ